jgi:hypothetical protein
MPVDIYEDFRVYTQFCRSTYPNLPIRESIANCVISLIGEYDEWTVEAPGVKAELLEAGDVLYYLTVLCDTLDIDIADLVRNICREDVDRDLDPDTFWSPYGSLTDLTKKHLFYYPPTYSRSEYVELMKPVIQQFLTRILAEWSYYTVITSNIKKLAARYQIPNPMEQGVASWQY